MDEDVVCTCVMMLAVYMHRLTHVRSRAPHRLLSWASRMYLFIQEHITNIRSGNGLKIYTGIIYRIAGDEVKEVHKTTVYYMYILPLQIESWFI